MSAEEETALLKQELSLVRTELDEFRSSSKELEEELEKELDRANNESQLWKSRADSNKREAEEWKARHEALARSSAQEISRLEAERDGLKARAGKDATRIRELEIGNDELEMATRVAMSSIQDLQSRYNSTLERLAFLQQELDAAKDLELDLQRIKDELREAEDEIQVLRSRGGTVTGSPAEKNGKEEQEGSVGAETLVQRMEQLGVVEQQPKANEPTTPPKPTSSPISPLPGTLPSPSLLTPSTTLPLLPSTPQSKLQQQATPPTPSAFSLVSSAASAGVTAIAELLGRARAIEQRLAQARQKYLREEESPGSSESGESAKVPGAWEDKIQGGV